MTDAVIIKTRKFKRNPLLARKQVCFMGWGFRFAWICSRNVLNNGMTMRSCLALVGIRLFDLIFHRIVSSFTFVMLLDGLVAYSSIGFYWQCIFLTVFDASLLFIIESRR